MPTPAAVEPPTPKNIHLYRAAVLAWRKAAIEERSRHADIRLANPHVPNHAAALAAHTLALAADASRWTAAANAKAAKALRRCARKWLTPLAP